MKKKKKLKKIILIMIIAVVLYVLLITLIVILGNLRYSGYFLKEECSDKEFIQAKQNAEIDFSKLIEEWDIAILLTNKNEHEIIQKYKDKGIINQDFRYAQMDPSIYQLCIIIFIKDGVEIDRVFYDKRYNEIKCKNEEYFYNTEAVFKVNKKGNKYIIEQE